jgi:hypothetical protein
MAAQAAIAMSWKRPYALDIVNEVLSGVLTVVVTCAAFGDVTGATRRSLVERAFERSWAVILIGLGTDLFAAVGLLGLQAPGIVNQLLASAVLLMTATLVFATVDATINDDPWWLLLPVSFSRSILVAFRRTVFPRALIVLALGEVGAQWVLLVLQSTLVSMHVSQPALWASGLVTALIVPPVQTFATFVYLDAIGYDAKRSCGQ